MPGIGVTNVREIPQLDLAPERSGANSNPRIDPGLEYTCALLVSSIRQIVVLIRQVKWRVEVQQITNLEL
jgi:hypothetical protein